MRIDKVLICLYLKIIVLDINVITINKQDTSDGLWTRETVKQKFCGR